MALILLIFFMVLVAVSVAAGLFCIGLGGYARVKLPENPQGPEELKLLGFSIKSRGGALGFVFAGIVLLLANVTLLDRQLRLVQASTTVQNLQSRLNTLQASHDTLANQEEQLKGLHAQLSSTLERLDELATRTSIAAIRKDLKQTATLKDDIGRLETQTERLRNEQASVASTQQTALAQITATADLIDKQLRELRALERKLARMETYNQVTQLVDTSLLREFTPTTWSPALAAGWITTDWGPPSYVVEFEGDTLSVKVFAPNEEAIARIEEAFPLEQIQDLASSNGLQFKADFQTRSPN